MSESLGIVLPALLAGLIVTATHVPLGMQVLARGIVFIDLAIAQIAGLGVILAGALGLAEHGPAVQAAALAAALAGAALLHWTERLWPDVQEAVIGVVFVLAANAALLLLASNPHGAEHLKDLLTGQVLWVNATSLAFAALASAAVLVFWKACGSRAGRFGFYGTFACAVTVSVQLVGVYLVFASLIIPALASRRLGRGRVPVAVAVSALGYASGLLLSIATDLPAGPLIVCTMTACGLAAATFGRRRASEREGFR